GRARRRPPGALGGRPCPRARRSRRSGPRAAPGTTGRAGSSPSPHGSTGTTRSPVALLHAEGRRFVQDLDRLLLFAVLSAKPAQFLALRAGQLARGALALAGLGPAVPAAQGLGADAEFPCDGGDRLSRGVDERDRVPLELLGVPLRVLASHL